MYKCKWDNKLEYNETINWSIMGPTLSLFIRNTGNNSMSCDLMNNNKTAMNNSKTTLLHWYSDVTGSFSHTFQNLWQRTTVNYCVQNVLVHFMCFLGQAKLWQYLRYGICRYM